MKTKLLVPLTVSSFVISHWSFGQGALTPPGLPAPTMKSLDQIEPRTPISSLPYTINNPGTYYLTTNLTGTSGISVRASGVTLDLMGFELVGGTNSGISVTANHTNICVRNGTIRGWSVAGADFGNSSHCQCTRLRFIGNGVGGLFAGQAALVDGCVAVGNLLVGIQVSDGSRVSECLAENNTGTGIAVIDNSMVRDCEAVNNSNIGINVGAGCLVKDCAATSSGSDGIVCGDNGQIIGCNARNNSVTGIHAGTVTAAIRCTVRDCVCVGNGNSGLGADGISVGGDSVVTGCHASQNGNGSSNAGIHAYGSGSRIENNAVRDNTGWGILANSGDIVVRNSAGANTSGNYSPSSGANFGPVQAPNAATNPWANFVF